MTSSLRFLRPSPVLWVPRSPRHQNREAPAHSAKELAALSPTRSTRSTPLQLDGAYSGEKLVAALQEQTRRNTRLRTLGPIARVSIVDEKVCDDALALLAPSLEQYKGCDILDFLPGPGLWSQKVHDLLKPRSHLLADIKQDAFEPFLRRLVKESDDPTYSYTSFEAKDTGLNRRRVIYSDEILSRLKVESPDDRERPVLILGTYTTLPFSKRSHVMAGKNADIDIAESIAIESSPAEHNFHNIIQYISRLEDHQRRPLRSLIWTLDRDKFNFMPRSAQGRKTTAVETEELFSVQEVVGWDQMPRRAKGLTRSAFIEFQSAVNVARASSPGTHLDDIPAPVSGVLKPVLEQKIPLSELEWRFDRTTTLLIDVAFLELYYSRNNKVPEAKNAMQASRVQKYVKLPVAKELNALKDYFEGLRGTFRHAEHTNWLEDYGTQVIMVELEKSIKLGKSTQKYIVPVTDAISGDRDNTWSQLTVEQGFVVRVPPPSELPHYSEVLAQYTKPPVVKFHAETLRGPFDKRIYKARSASSSPPESESSPPPPLQPIYVALTYLQQISSKRERESGSAFLNNHYYVPAGMIDNHFAFHRPSPDLEPLLAWDRRTFEPLPSDPESFYPKHHLALLDFVARDRKPIPQPPPADSQASSTSGAQHFTTLHRHPLMRRLKRHESRTLPLALARTAHGADVALIQKCPSLADPLRGGRLPGTEVLQGAEHQMRVRMFTDEHWTDLLKAWYDWPFRKTDMELESELGTTSLFVNIDGEKGEY